MSRDGHTPAEQRSYTLPDRDGREVEALRVVKHDRAVRTGGAPAYDANDRAETMLAQVDRRIAEVRGQLSEVSRYNPADGSPIYQISDPRRRADLQRELDNLESHTRPLTARMAAEAEAFHAAQPTADDKLRATLEKRQRISAKAEEVAEALEAEKQAEALVRSRKLGIG